MSANYSLLRRLTAEGLGTAFLLAAVVGSGIMAERLSGGNFGLDLLSNAIATGCALFVLIVIFGPISGAHFNPSVTLVFAIRRDISWREALAYVPFQIVGGILGVYATHIMFGEPIFQLSVNVRNGPGQWFSELVATFGLIVTILCSQRFRPALTPATVALYIVSAYWFTASTSFANPAVTVARSLSDTFAGIAPQSVPAFIGAQFAGALSASYLLAWLLEPNR